MKTALRVLLTFALLLSSNSGAFSHRKAFRQPATLVVQKTAPKALTTTAHLVLPTRSSLKDLAASVHATATELSLWKPKSREEILAKRQVIENELKTALHSFPKYRADLAGADEALDAMVSLLSKSRLLGRQIQDSNIGDAVSHLVGERRYVKAIAKAESAVELEDDLKHTLIEAMTTTDGTIGALFKDIPDKMPQTIIGIAKSKRTTPEALQWDVLTAEQKREVLVSAMNGKDFFANRQIPGLAMRRSIVNRAGKAIRLGGKTYQSGEQVDVSNYLLTKVEMRGPNDLDGVEIHVRAKGNAKAVLEDAFAIRTMLGSSYQAAHHQLVAELDPLVAAGDRVARVEFVDFFRRASMVALCELVVAGANLSDVKSDQGALYFGFSNMMMQMKLRKELVNFAKNKKWTYGHEEFKLQELGFRYGESFLGRMNLVSVENRSIVEGVASGDLNQAIQYGLLSNNYGIPRSKFVKRLDDIQNQYKAERYEGEFEDMATPHFASVNTDRLIERIPGISQKTKKRLITESAKDRIVDLLVFDYSDDVALLENPAALAKLKLAQRNALTGYEMGLSLLEAGQLFIKQSEILNIYKRSIGMTSSSATADAN